MGFSSLERHDFLDVNFPAIVSPVFQPAHVRDYSLQVFGRVHKQFAEVKKVRARFKTSLMIFLLGLTFWPASARAQTFPSDIIETIIRRYLGISNTQTPIGVTDGNPQATTAVFASDAFNIYGIQPLLGMDPKNNSNNYAWRGDATYGEINTDVIDGYYVTLNLAQGWRLTDRIGIVYSVPIEFRDTEGAQVFISGFNVGLPITLIRERDEEGLSWGVTPWAVGGAGASDELDQGAIVYGGGGTSSLSLRHKRLKFTLADQISYETGEPFSYGSFFNNEQPIHQTIVKNGLKVSFEGRFMVLNGAIIYTDLLDGGFIDNYWSPAAGIGLRLGPNGYLGIGYSGDSAPGYHANAIKVLLQLSL
jgi:hypothetical protein